MIHEFKLLGLETLLEKIRVQLAFFDELAAPGEIVLLDGVVALDIEISVFFIGVVIVSLNGLPDKDNHDLPFRGHLRFRFVA